MLLIMLNICIITAGVEEYKNNLYFLSQVCYYKKIEEMQRVMEIMVILSIERKYGRKPE